MVPVVRGVAQSGSALALGARCRRFKSSHPDHLRWFCLVSQISRQFQKLTNQAAGGSNPLTPTIFFAISPLLVFPAKAGIQSHETNRQIRLSRESRNPVNALHQQQVFPAKASELRRWRAGIQSTRCTSSRVIPSEGRNPVPSPFRPSGEIFPPKSPITPSPRLSYSELALFRHFFRVPHFVFP